MSGDLVRATVLVAVLLMPTVAAAQTNGQLWSEFRFDWIPSKELTLSFDIEPKVLVSKPAGDPGWATLDLTPSLELTHGPWIDVLGELLVGRTKQTDDVDSTEVTPRVGVRLHVLSNISESLLKERVPRRRLVLRDLLRLEWRHLYYSTDQRDASTVRLRNRVEALYPLTRPNLTTDGAIYLTSDVELFWPQHDPAERFANKQRIRGGIGYRRSKSWRFEALYIWDRARDSANEGFTDVDHALDIKVRRVW
jgi:hypothetical protein